MTQEKDNVVGCLIFNFVMWNKEVVPFHSKNSSLSHSLSFIFVTLWKYIGNSQRRIVQKRMYVMSPMTVFHDSILLVIHSTILLSYDMHSLFHIGICQVLVTDSASWMLNAQDLINVQKSIQYLVSSFLLPDSHFR